MANPNNYPPKPAYFVEFQNRVGYTYAHYRATGDDDLDVTLPEHVERIAARTQPVGGLAPFQHPVPGSATARALLSAAIRNRGQVRLRQGIFTVNAAGPDVEHGDIRFARTTLNNASTRAQLRSTGISFVRRLGWGGNGLATLWSFTDPASNTANVVCKSRYSSVFAFNDLRNERRKLRTLARSPHIIHQVDLRQVLGPLPLAEAAVDDANDLVINLDILWLEYMKHGDLEGWLARVTHQGQTFPRSVLWRMFQCLAEACVSMAYPPRNQANPSHGINGPDLPEVIPPNPASGYSNFVHFDLDVYNIFIQGFDDAFHRDVPRLQAGDFGRAMGPQDLGVTNLMPVPPDNFDNFCKLWASRSGTKAGWCLPEQFTAEWDHVNYEPYSEGITNTATGAGAAGAYTEKTNIFHIGMTIWCCMLLHKPEFPPRATPIPPRNHGPNVMGSRGWTYAGELRFQTFRSQFGAALCGLVMDCCMHMPMHRPGLAGLRARIAAGVAANPVTGDDRRFVRDTLFGPGNPPPAYPIPGTQPPGEFAFIPL